MPAEWIPIAVKAAMVVAGPVLSDAYKTSRAKIESLFSDGPLSGPLQKAFEKAFAGFHGSLAASFPLDEDAENGLAAMAKHEDFAAAVSQLPFVPFQQIDTTRLRELFEALGPQGTDGSDFDAAWRALGRRFMLATAESPELKSLVELSHAARQESREEVKQEKIASIEALLERLVLATEASGRPRDDGPLLRRYRSALYERYRYADTRGLFMREKEGVGEGIELRDVFVETHLALIVEEKVRKKEKREQAQEEAAEKSLLEEEILSTESPLGALISQERLTVILGPPGSGKSTLVRCLCLTLCRPEGVDPILEHGLSPETVPVLLNLKEFASALQQTPHLALDRFLLDRFEKDLPSLEALLNEGRTVVLLDGLDEVFDESHRRWVSDEAWRLMTRFPETRFVLTSRPHGYRAAPLPGPVTRWQLQPFGEERIGRFFRGWFEALAREGAEAGFDESPTERAENLTAEVLARPRLEEMAQNPLLCTLIVLVHRSRSGRLPQRRVVFYEAAVRTLAEVWERMKHYPQQEGKARLEIPEPEILIRAMAEVAWRALHELGSREISSNQLHAWFREYLEREPEWRGERGDRAVRDLLQLVGERTGLLTDLGGSRYQFVHLSLHEWLTSYFLLDRLTESERQQVVRHYLHAPEWEEVLRLLIAGAPQAQADILVKSILQEPSSELENILRRDLRFICRCFGDLAPVGPGIRAQVEDLLAQVISDGELEDLSGLLEDAAGIVISADATRSALLSLLESEGPSVRSSVARFFARFGADDSATRSALQSRLTDDDPYVLRFAVDFFVRVGADDAATRSSLLSLLGSDDLSVRLSAVEFFVQVGADDVATRSALLSLLGSDDLFVRRSAVEFFARVGADDAATRSGLLSLLGSDDPLVRRSAVEFFARVGADDAVTRSGLLSLLGSDDPFMRRSAVEFFARVGVDDATRSALLSLLGSDDPLVRRSAVEFFAQVGVDDAATRSGLLSLLGSDNPSVRLSAVEFFVLVGADDSTTRSALLSLLGSDDPSLRRSAAEFFALVGADDMATRSALLSLLGSDDPSVRRSAAEFSARFGADDVATRSALLSLLGSDDPSVRSPALEFFARVGVDDAATRSVLLSRLSDEHPYVRSLAVDCLTRIGADDLTIREALLSKLENTHSVEYASAFKVLLRLGFPEWSREDLLAVYANVSSSTSPQDDERFALEVGRLAAFDSELRSKILEKGREIPYFRRGLALRTMLLEQDRTRRTQQPLVLPVPGCAV